MIKHDKIETRNFKNIESRRCPHCGKISHNTGACNECITKLYCRSCTHLLDGHDGTPTPKLDKASVLPECSNCAKCSSN